jgi:ribosomal protein S12 methylthiotransferase accessory factor
MAVPAPPPERRAPAACAFLDRLAAGAASFGVTRLAEITRLDRIGLPVWQAVRPAGRALSVHQGKGPSAEEAKVGALCEALESHCAETVIADGPLCSWADLSSAERAGEPADFARRRDKAGAADAPILWCEAEDLLGGRRLWLPYDLVSLDFSRPAERWIDRSSTGLGAGATEADAVRTALLELIERDAVGAWQRSEPAARFARRVALETIPYSWFGGWRELLTAAGADLAAFAPESPSGYPVAVCWVGGGEAFGARYRSFSGSACHPDPELALFKALAEAVQSRLTFIAGVRDDILPSHYRLRHAPIGDGGDLCWGRVGPAPAVRPAEGLAALGYTRIAVKRLACPLQGVSVVKAFVPRLGSLKRTRRGAE